ncbi:MAG: hypothetical protein HGB20_05130 [Chlorobiaceae bacterium]|jgi:hypothetical protein|nr:hypothetical protein [Chlorobiaceae bacterium]
MADEQPTNSRDEFSTQSDESEKIVQFLTEALSNTVESVSAIIGPLTRTFGELNDRLANSVNDVLKFLTSSIEQKK